MILHAPSVYRLGRTWWQPSGPGPSDPQSLAHHSRFWLNGTQTFRSLKTKVFAVAKLKHANAKSAALVHLPAKLCLAEKAVIGEEGTRDDTFPPQVRPHGACHLLGRLAR